MTESIAGLQVPEDEARVVTAWNGFMVERWLPYEGWQPLTMHAYRDRADAEAEAQRYRENLAAVKEVPCD